MLVKVAGEKKTRDEDHDEKDADGAISNAAAAAAATATTTATATASATASTNSKTTTKTTTSTTAATVAVKKRSTKMLSPTVLCPVILFLIVLQLTMSFSASKSVLSALDSLFHSSNPSSSAQTSVDTAAIAAAAAADALEVYNDELAPLNILILYPDDWRYDVIGDAQPGVVHTPFLTKLAKNGIRFTHNVVTTSICWISRATLFTGRYVSQHKSTRLYCPIFTMPSIWNGTWPAILQRYGGYFVGHVGKWQFHSKNGPGQFFNFSKFHEGRHWYSVNKQRVHASDRARDDAIEFLRQRPKDRNFALTVAFYPPKPLGLSKEPGKQWEPDAPYRAIYENFTFIPPYDFSQAFAFVPSFVQSGVSRAKYMERYESPMQYQESLKNYNALVTHVDKVCQDIITELEDQGVLNRTLIIVTADNGMMMGAHGLGGKWHPYQESIRVPLVVYDPRMAASKRGTTDDSYTLNIDLAPTIVGAANLSPDPRMQGRDLADIYVKRKETQQEEQKQQQSFPTSLSSLSSLLLDNTKFVSGENPMVDDSYFGIDKVPWRNEFYYEFPLREFPDSTALVTRQYKYIRWHRKGKELLFDLQNDPYEFRDLLTAANTRTNAQMVTLVNLLEHVGSQYQEVSNISSLLAYLQSRHDELQALVKEPFPGEEDYKCEKNISLYP